MPDVTPIPKAKDWTRAKDRRRKKAAKDRYLAEQSDIAYRRSGWRCQRCGVRAPLEIHHRIERGMGGAEFYAHRHQNLVVLCAGCHRWVHGNVADAKQGGWLA